MTQAWLIRTFILMGYFAYFITGLVNIGFVALDDYTDTIALSIPAQNHSFSSIVSETPDIRSLMPAATLLLITKTAHYLGINHPSNQLRFLLIFLGFLNFTVFWLVVTRVFKNHSKLCLFILATLGTYFLAPFLFTRAMIENLATPFVFLSAFLALDADKKKSFSSLALATIFLFFSFLFRNQTLSVLPVLFLIALTFPNKIQSLVRLCIVTLLLLVVTGLPDYFFRGEWHSSFFKYVIYNFNFSSTYGRTPFYAYFILFILLSWFPFSFSKTAYRRVYQNLRPYRSLVGFVIFFVGCHSLIAHKEERFMIPILPIFFVLLSFLWVELNKIQFFIVFCFNLCFLFLTSLSISQNNIIGPTLYLDRHPKFKNLISVDHSVLFLPEAYSLHPINIQTKTMAEAIEITDCETVFATHRDKFNEAQEKWRYLKVFKPGPLEQLIIRLNPGQNSRRQTIYLFTPPGCVPNH